MKTNIDLPVSVKSVTVNINARNILEDVSLFFPPGTHFLVGRNGSGKTTLLEVICGLRPAQGSVEVLGEPISSLSATERAKRIALVPQRSSFNHRISLHDFMLLGRFARLGFWGVPTLEDKEKVDEWISFLGMNAFSRRFISTLSGGEFQKALIGRGLCQETPVILLDEPCQSLDPPSQEMVYALIERIGKTGKTVLCVSHDAEPIHKPGFSVIGFKNGKIAWQGMSGPETWEILRVKDFS